MSGSIPFNRPRLVGPEIDNIRDALAAGHLSGDGMFTRRCHAELVRLTGAASALLAHSCTAALEMAAILAEVGPGDEVIMPSYTFVSTANAFVLRGATPVFVDVRPDTLNLDETRVEEAITSRTRAIVPVHYAGVACEMDALLALADRHGLLVVEDAAQGLGASYKGRPLGAIGDLGALSFHETKNVISGEGGALLLRDRRFVERAEIIREKGTNRGAFFRGHVDKYTWVDIGSSYLPSEIIAAFLHAQLEQADSITRARADLWNRYYEAFADLETRGVVRRPSIPAHCGHNAHLFYLLMRDAAVRQRVLDATRAAGVGAIFHYVPLHSSPAGLKYGRAVGSLDVTDSVSARLVRLPLWNGLAPQIDRVIEIVRNAVEDYECGETGRRNTSARNPRHHDLPRSPRDR
jgi:dTDP-4-amino-4,6-dideoxygalactose transaminase